MSIPIHEQVGRRIIFYQNDRHLRQYAVSCPTLISIEIWPDAASAENALRDGLVTWENDPDPPEAPVVFQSLSATAQDYYVVERLRERRETAMLRDDRSDEGGRRRSPRNVLGEPLDICSINPMTGFYRDGCCNTGREDVGSHTVCAVMTSAFLEFSKSHGNDLSTPLPEFGFPGLKAGDRWCLCAPRWQEAFEAGHAPRVVLRATHEGALAYCSLADLKRFAVDLA